VSVAPRRGLAPAKVNLALHVTGRRADGYHLLDSLVAFADLGDGLEVGPGDALEVTGPFAAGVPTDGRNLIRRALAVAGLRRAVRLDKRLPHPAGLGGGSSDAATVLRLAGADLPAEALLGLGADVPVCMLGRAARMRGIGEAVTPVALPPLPAVLVNPGVPVPTGAVFAAMARRDNPAMPEPPKMRDAGAAIAWLSRQRNDLEAPARGLAPEIGAAVDALRAAGAPLARMTGSGATCFGLWPDRAAARAAARALARPGWWVAPCMLA
jgi:4-diphosphocytidyl-2-C-methyl-D-erythritol kinase